MCRLGCSWSRSTGARPPGWASPRLPRCWRARRPPAPRSRSDSARCGLRCVGLCYRRPTLIPPSYHPRPTLIPPSYHPRTTLIPPSYHPRTTMVPPSCRPPPPMHRPIIHVPPHPPTPSLSWHCSCGRVRPYQLLPSPTPPSTRPRPVLNPCCCAVLPSHVPHPPPPPLSRPVSTGSVHREGLFYSQRF